MMQIDRLSAICMGCCQRNAGPAVQQLFFFYRKLRLRPSDPSTRHDHRTLQHTPATSMPVSGMTRPSTPAAWRRRPEGLRSKSDQPANELPTYKAAQSAAPPEDGSCQLQPLLRRRASEMSALAAEKRVLIAAQLVKPMISRNVNVARPAEHFGTTPRRSFVSCHRERMRL